MILAFTFPAILFGYLAGVFVDHQNLKKVLIVTNLLRALIIFCLIFFVNSLIVLYTAVLLLAFVTLFFFPAEGSAIPALVRERKDLIAANSLFTLTVQITLIAGFVVGGPALAFLGEGGTLFVLALLFAVALSLVWFLPNTIRSLEEREGIHSPLKTFIDGIVFFFKNRSVRDAVFFLTSTQAVILVLATITPGFVDKVLGLDVKLASVVLVAPAAFGMILGSFGIGHLGHLFKERYLVNFGLFVVGADFLVLSLLETAIINKAVYLLAVLLIVLLGAATSFITVPTTTELQSETPERFRGRTYGILGTFGSGVSVLPVLAAGALGDSLGIRTVLLALGVLTLIVALYRLKFNRYT